MNEILNNNELKEIEVKLDYLINRTKVNFLEMGALFKQAKMVYEEELSKTLNIKSLSELPTEKRTGHGFMSYATQRFSLSAHAINTLIKVYDKFGDIVESGGKLPYNDYTKLGMIASLPADELNNILCDIYVFDNKEVKGEDLNREQLREVLREKRELQEQLNKHEEEKRKEIEDKSKLIVSLTQEKKAIEDSFNARISEELSKATDELSRTVEKQIKAKYSDEIRMASEALEKARLEHANAQVELKKLESTKRAVLNQKKENDKMISIINEKEKVMEEYDKNRRILEIKINELNSTVAGLNNQKKDLAEGIQRVKEISEFTKCLNEMITLSNEFEKDVYCKYLEHEDIRKYLVPTVNNAIESLQRFDDKLHKRFKPIIINGDKEVITNE